MEEHTADPKPRRGIRWLLCCGFGSGPPRDKKPKRERRAHRPRRRRSHKQNAGPPPTKLPSNVTSRGESCQQSIVSDEDWHDVQDAFSIGDPGEAGHSPLASIPDSPRGSTYLDAHGADGVGAPRGAWSDEEEDGEEEGSLSGSERSGPGIGARLVGCLGVMRHGQGITGEEPGVASPRGAPVAKGPRPPAGFSLQRRPPHVDPLDSRHCWEESDATTFHIRSVDYMRNKVKVSSAKSIYRLVAMDLIQTDAKAFHLARHVSLPRAARGAPAAAAAAGDDAAAAVALPPLLVFNIQMPSYPASLFGGTGDGAGQSIVYYFALPEDFDPAKFENQAALGLLHRFVSNGREADGQPTRERLKLIARVANPEEWAQKAPLSGAELRVLVSYNEKPVLTRPQHHFFTGPNYLEVDVDVHSYAYLARKALDSYHSRLGTVVWEVAFVLQGNASDELPEQVLGCGRVYRSDFGNCRRLSDFPSCCAQPAGGSITPQVRAESQAHEAQLAASASATRQQTVAVQAGG